MDKVKMISIVIFTVIGLVALGFNAPPPQLEANSVMVK
jgi:hypothetical protein